MEIEHDYEPDPEVAEGQTALVRVTSEGDPEQFLMVLEKKAKLAGRMRQAIESIVVSQTYPADWTVQGDGDKAKACLSSAGAERIARNFPIRYHDVKWVKEEFEDTHGKAYRYVFTGYATMNERTVVAEGRYGTRDKFLAFANKEWRPTEDINENSIRSAAYHIFCGNAVKALLGLRGIPANEYRRIMTGTGRKPTDSGDVTRGKGTQGGTNEDDSRHQNELAELCVLFADNALTANYNHKSSAWELVPISDSDSRPNTEIADEICVKLSTFTKDGKEVKGKVAKNLRDKWLNSTLGKARKLKEILDNGGDPS